MEKPLRKTFRRAAQSVDVQTMMTIAFEMGSRGQDCRELNFRLEIFVQHSDTRESREKTSI